MLAIEDPEDRGFAFCSVAGCNMTFLYAGPFCACEEEMILPVGWSPNSANVKFVPSGALRIRGQPQQHAELVPHAIVKVDVAQEEIIIDAPGTWQPAATSLENRAVANAVHMSDGIIADKPPQRYSDAACLARCMGHHLKVRDLPAPSSRELEMATQRKAAGLATACDQATLSHSMSRGVVPSIDLVVCTDRSKMVPEPEWRDIARDGDVALRPREIKLPVPTDFEWPVITHFAFYEDKGEIRESFAARGHVSASVADRAPQIPPSEGCFAIIGQVYDFIQCYPHPIRANVNHVECGPASWSSFKTWPQKILDGRMLAAAEELLLINCIGDRSLGEQPHTAHEHVIGPPTQVFNAHEHGASDKTWVVWRRGVPAVKPTDIVPLSKRREELSTVKGTREEKMLRRSRTPRKVADAITAAFELAPSPPTEAGRPANQPCAAYFNWRRAMHHNFRILASSYAPTISVAVISDSTRVLPIAYIMPIAPTPSGPCVLVPLQHNAISFGVVLQSTPSHEEQVSDACKFISVGIKDQFMQGTNTATHDFVVAVPWDTQPVTTVNTPDELARAVNEKAPSVWCTMDAIANSPAHEPAWLAVSRVAAMQGAVDVDDAHVGIWDKAKPVLASRAAREYGRLPINPQANELWQAFLAEERHRAAVMKADIMAADGGTNLIARICEDVRCAADFAAELPTPPQGMPTYTDPSLLLVRVLERPLELHRDWIHQMPPQQAPPGFKPLRWNEALRDWAVRLIVTHRNDCSKYDGYCLDHGAAPSDMRRPQPITLGRGAACLFPHADGVGTYNPMDFILELHDDDGLFHLMDFTTKSRDWVYKVIEHHIGATTNQEMMAFLFHGTRYKIETPRQIRIAKNLERLDTLMSQAQDSLRSFAKRGYIQIHKVCRADVGLTADGPPPSRYFPWWDTPFGCIIKGDGTGRVVGDMTDPHDKIRERNKPHGEPDGPWVVSLNDLSGPKGGAKEGYTGPLPFPEPEPKPRPRDKYVALALLRFYANLLRTFVVTLDDDIRHMFFQFNTAKCDRPLNVWNTVMDFNEYSVTLKLTHLVRYLVTISVDVMNMGWRNASKVGSNFAWEWLDAWAREFDTYVGAWIKRQNRAFIDAYEQRLDSLGHVQARPFWGAVYTDNFDMSFASSELGAQGTLLWKRMNKDANIWLQDHVQYGTCSDWIGGRSATMGGFGCLVPSKQARATHHCRAAIDGQLDRETFESNNSFLVHVADICDWPKGMLKGVNGPLAVPGFDTDIVIMTPTAHAVYLKCIDLLRTRPLASFWCGIKDAFFEWGGNGRGTKPIRVHASDCCTDPAPHEHNATPSPHVAGIVDGIFWRFKLTGEWLDRHITLTESAGPAIGMLMTVPIFPDDINCLAADATSATAAAVGTSSAPNLITMKACLEDEPEYATSAKSAWTKHWKGWGNGLSDLLSRDNMHLAFRLADAFGIKLVELPISKSVTNFMWRTLVLTRPVPPDAFQVEVRGIDGKTVMLYAHTTQTVEQLLEAYKAKVNMAAAVLRIVAGGKQLDTDKTVGECGVGAHATLHVRAGIPGGMQEVPAPPSPMVSNAQSTRQAAGSSAADARLPPPPPSPPPSRSMVSVPASPMPVACMRPTVPLRESPRHAQRRHQSLKEVPDLAPPRERRAGSPQPITAKAARAAYASSTAERLSSINTEYAICPDDPEKLKHMVAEAHAAGLAGIPKGTNAADEWGFKHMVGFAQDCGPTVRWMRPRVGSADIDEENEAWFVSCAAGYLAQVVKPSARRRKRGYTQGLPTTPLLAIYGWRRVQKDCGRYLCDMKLVRKHVRGLCMLYKKVWGPEAFEVQQAGIFLRVELVMLCETCVTYGVAGWSVTEHDVWHVIVAYEVCTGERKDAWTSAFEGDDVLKRGNFSCIDKNAARLIMTAETIVEAREREGSLVEGTCAPSKCDRLNIVWSKQKQYFRVRRDDTFSFAYLWLQFEAKYPCPLEKRSTWPAFSPYGNEETFAPHRAAVQHKQLCVTAIGAKAEDKTVHSHRATFASSLTVARAEGNTEITDGVTQALIRWKTLASLMSYNKLTPNSYANLVEKGTAADAGLVNEADVPEHGPEETLNELEQTMSALDQGLKPEPASTAVLPGANHPADKRVPPAPTPANAPSAAAALPAIEVVGYDAPVSTAGKDSWQLLGSNVDLPNSLWGEEDGGTTTCTIAHFLNKHKFPGLAQKRVAYAVSLEGDGGLYAVRADTIRDHLEPSRKRALRRLHPTMPKPVA